MTLLWLGVWLLQGTPQLHQWNNWLVSLIIVLVVDAVEGGGSRA